MIDRLSCSNSFIVCVCVKLNYYSQYQAAVTHHHTCKQLNEHSWLPVWEQTLLRLSWLRLAVNPLGSILWPLKLSCRVPEHQSTTTFFNLWHQSCRGVPCEADSGFTGAHNSWADTWQTLRMWSFIICLWALSCYICSPHRAVQDVVSCHYVTSLLLICIWHWPSWPIKHSDDAWDAPLITN